MAMTSELRLPSDHAQRREALDPRQSFLIQAPAGSGKTELLTDRILALLATVNRPEEIVAITFTRKAASEMHARVLEKLRKGDRYFQDPDVSFPERERHSMELARAAVARDRELGWNLLQYPARLSIRTIDAFCSWLVRGMPWLSAMGGLPAVTEDAQGHYVAAARATLAMADEFDALRALLAHLDVDLRAAEGLLARMLASRDQWMPLLEEGSDLERLMSNLDASIEQDLRAVRDVMPLGWAETLAPWVRLAAAALQAGEAPSWLEPLLDWDGQALGDAPEDVVRWQALAGLLLTNSNGLRRTVNKNHGFEPKAAHKDAFLEWLKSFHGNEAWINALASVRLLPPDGYRPGQLAILHELLQVLWLACAQLRLRFAEAGEVDFLEIAQRALHALGQADDPSDLLLSLDASIRHLLVDEFQDTSQSQIDLLTRLTSGWQPDDGRTLFLVGDPMQSIYRFRKAEVGWFLKVREEGLGELRLKALSLTNNFRSQAGVVEWVNQVFGPLFPAEEHPGLGAIPYSRSVAFNGPLDVPGVLFHPVWVRSRTEQDEAESVASEDVVVDLVKQALARHPDRPKPVAILVRARSHLEQVVSRLARERIPCRAVDLVSLRSRQVVADLTQLARALSHPADRLAWLAVLRSPLCGLQLSSLHALFGERHHVPPASVLAAWTAGEGEAADVLDDDEAGRLRHACAVLLDAGNASGSIPFAAWLEQCWRRLGGHEVYSSVEDISDAESFFRLVEKMAPYGGLNPAELEAQLEKLYAQPEGAPGAVEVMTIHKSKGLQFDTVILMGLHRRPRGDVPPLLRFEQSEGRLLLGPIKHRASDDPDPVSAYLEAREKQRAANEADRLLYVGATRAVQQLHLVGELALSDEGKVIPPAPTSMLGRLWGHMLPPEPPGVPGATEAPADRPPVSVQRYLWRRQALPSMPDRPDLRSERGMFWQWPAKSEVDSVAGTVAHAWLERLGRDGAQAWTVSRVESSRPAIRKQLTRAGLSDEASIEAAESVVQTLAATLSSERGRWLLRAARAYREWSLLDISGRVSVIDLAISDESGWLVVDYKTGVPRAGESLEAFAESMRERYQDQIQRYLAHVQALDGRPARGALYFPRVDLWLEC